MADLDVSIRDIPEVDEFLPVGVACDGMLHSITSRLCP